MAQNVTVGGLKELQARLQQISATIGEKGAAKPVTDALRKAGRVLIRAMQQNLIREKHVMSGALVDNLVTKRVKSPNGTVRIHVGVRSNAKKYKETHENKRRGRVGKGYRSYGPLFYGRFLEFGTSHQQKSAFMRPAFDEHKEELPVIVRDDLKDRLRTL